MTISALPPNVMSLLETLGLTNMPNEWNLSSTEDGISLLLNWNEDGTVQQYASPLRFRGMKSPSTRRRDQQRMQAYLIRQKDQKVSDCHESAPQVSAKSTVQQPDGLLAVSSTNQTFQANASGQSVPATASVGVQCDPESKSKAIQCVPMMSAPTLEDFDNRCRRLRSSTCV